MKRTRLLLFMLLVLSTSSVCHGQWKKLFQFSSGAHCIYFLDGVGHPEIGFVGLADGRLWRTSDRGISWQKVLTASGNLMIDDITFKDPMTGWLVPNNRVGGSPSSVYHTIDGGLSWQQERSGGMLTSIYYHKFSQTLFLSEWDAGGFSSTDDGASWTQFSSDMLLNGYAFTSATSGMISFAGADPTSILTTGDGGSSWQFATPFPVACWQAAGKPGTSTFFIFSEYRTNLIRSDDNGATWRFISTIGNNSVAFTGCTRLGQCNEIFIQSEATTNNGFFESTDEGLTWISIGGPSNDIDTRFCISGTDLFATDNNGALWVFSTGTGSATLNIPSNSIHLQSMDCDTVSVVFPLHSVSCIVGIDSIISGVITGNTHFVFSSGEVIPRGFVADDSMKILYYHLGNGSDTATLNLRCLIGGKEVDTSITLFGTSLTTIQTVFAPQIRIRNGGKTAVIQPGKDTSVYFSVSTDIPSVAGMDSLTFDLHFKPDMLKLDSANCPSGWKITAQEVQPGSWNCRFYNVSHSDIPANQPLSYFFFSSFVAKDTISPVLLKSGTVFFDPVKHAGCTTASMPQDDSASIEIQNICGAETLRNFLSSGAIDVRIVSIRPNPASHEIAIETESSSARDVEVTIYDDLGRTFLSEKHTIQGSTTLDLPIASIPSGTYHLLLTSASGSVSSDFVKLH